MMQLMQWEIVRASSSMQLMMGSAWTREDVDAAFMEGCCPEGHRLEPTADDAGRCDECNVRIIRQILDGLPAYTLVRVWSE